MHRVRWWPDGSVAELAAGGVRQLPRVDDPARAAQVLSDLGRGECPCSDGDAVYADLNGRPGGRGGPAGPGRGRVEARQARAPTWRTHSFRLVGEDTRS